MHILLSYQVVKSNVSELHVHLRIIQKYYFVMKQLLHLILKRLIRF